MAIQTLADWNAANEFAWIAWGQRRSYLIERTYIRHIINAGGFATSGTCNSPAEAFEQLQREPSFEFQIFKEAEERASSGTFRNQKTAAAQPRWKAARADLSRRQIVSNFALKPDNRRAKTKSLWDPFFQELTELGLSPSTIDHPSDLGQYAYIFAGKRKNIAITYRQFEKLVSELAPRRPRKE